MRHLHAFVAEVEPSRDEWMAGVQFLAAVGQSPNGSLEEFILLSDVLGLSTLVTAQCNDKPAGCTEATVLGPFHVEGAPHFELGADVAAKITALIELLESQVPKIVASQASYDARNQLNLSES